MWFKLILWYAKLFYRWRSVYVYIRAYHWGLCACGCVRVYTHISKGKIFLPILLLVGKTGKNQVKG